MSIKEYKGISFPMRECGLKLNRRFVMINPYSIVKPFIGKGRAFIVHITPFAGG
jgi:hypothetical protein